LAKKSTKEGDVIEVANLSKYEAPIGQAPKKDRLSHSSLESVEKT
jgi:hypothetical protein